MAKCTICNSRKGKRKCKVDDTFICSLCCGQSRNPEKCNGCSFFKDALSQRNYRKVPFYEVHQMSASIELDEISNVVESTLCKFELESGGSFSDNNASKLIELYFDKFHFNDADLKFSNAAQEDQFNQILQVFNQDLPIVSEEQLVKVLATVYRSIQRRTNGGSEYLQFAQHYVGARVAQGARIISQ